MQQWEYRTATLVPFGWGQATNWKLRQLDEQELRDWNFTEGYSSLLVFCNQMGFQGWELVSVTNSNSSSSGERFFYFKRPI